MASAAIPGVLPAVDWDGRLLIDGGVTNNAPLTHAVELGADQIYVLPTGAPCELDQAPRGALAMLMYATGLLVGRRLAQEVSALDGRAKVVVLPTPCPHAVQPSDFGHAAELIDRSRADARALLDITDPPRPGPSRRRGARPAVAARRRRGSACGPSGAAL
jgi:NTE family protein